VVILLIGFKENHSLSEGSAYCGYQQQGGQNVLTVEEEFKSATHMCPVKQIWMSVFLFADVHINMVFLWRFGTN
jgi:hypothetical protein